MRLILLGMIVVTAATAVAWWKNPTPGRPDLSAFEDDGRSIVSCAPEFADVPRSVAIHYAVARRLAPAGGGLMIVAVCAGLFFRERRRFSSPTLAYLAKRTAVGGMLLLALFVVAPMGWTMASAYLAITTTSVGLSTYTANLPKRL